ncbi:hypothetical protein [Actinoplanes sp. L3-i22]|uniref:hypothetical protein n=1 Tax=Actinoplanes sp. L3-i22 TaxID=2836373 RepID=UPI001C85381A|nr:hypothetical protein [Actinoplanes sp. L3-i22]
MQVAEDATCEATSRNTPRRPSPGITVAQAPPHPDPAVDELAAAAVRLRAQAAELWADQPDTWMHDWSTRQHQRAAEEQKGEAQA